MCVNFNLIKSTLLALVCVLLSSQHITLLAPASSVENLPSSKVGDPGEFKQNEEEKLAPRDGDENPLQSWLNQMALRARNALDAKFNPKRDWFALIRRAHNWFSKYKRYYDLRVSLVSGACHLMAPVDVLAIEFARIDSEMYGEKLSNLETSDKREPKASELKTIETIDYLYDTLDKLIQRLESIDLDNTRELEEYLAVNSEKMGRLTRGEELRASRKFREAMERVKRIGMNTAEGVINNEVLVLVRMALINVLAAHIGHMGGSNPTGQSLDQLATLLLGATGPGMLVQYLADVNRRTLTMLLGVLNPLARLNENFAPLSGAGKDSDNKDKLHVQ